MEVWGAALVRSRSGWASSGRSVILWTCSCSSTSWSPSSFSWSLIFTSLSPSGLLHPLRPAHPHCGLHCSLLYSFSQGLIQDKWCFIIMILCQTFSQENSWILWVAMAFSIVLIIMLVCVESIRRFEWLCFLEDSTLQEESSQHDLPWSIHRGGRLASRSVTSGQFPNIPWLVVTHSVRSDHLPVRGDRGADRGGDDGWRGAGSDGLRHADQDWLHRLGRWDSRVLDFVQDNN